MLSRCRRSSALCARSPLARLKFIGLLIALIFLSRPVQAGWRLQELARGSNALLVEMDLLLSHKKTGCKLDAASVSQLSQNLRMLVDARAAELKNNKEQIITLLKTCQKDCTCDTYEYALEKITESETYSTTKKLSADQRQACAKKQPAFCKSRLFKAIK